MRKERNAIVDLEPSADSKVAKPRAILTRDQAIAIFQLRPTSESPSTTRASFMVARAYSVSEKTVRDIWRGRTWHRETVHLDPMRPARPEVSPGRPLGRKDSMPRRKPMRNFSGRKMSSASATSCSNANDPFHDDWPNWARADSYPETNDPTQAKSITVDVQNACVQPGKYKCDRRFASSPASWHTNVRPESLELPLSTDSAASCSLQLEATSRSLAAHPAITQNTENARTLASGTARPQLFCPASGGAPTAPSASSGAGWTCAPWNSDVFPSAAAAAGGAGPSPASAARQGSSSTALGPADRWSETRRAFSSSLRWRCSESPPDGAWQPWRQPPQKPRWRQPGALGLNLPTECSRAPQRPIAAGGGLESESEPPEPWCDDTDGQPRLPGPQRGLQPQPQPSWPRRQDSWQEQQQQQQHLHLHPLPQQRQTARGAAAAGLGAAAEQGPLGQGSG